MQFIEFTADNKPVIVPLDNIASIKGVAAMSGSTRAEFWANGGGKTKINFKAAAEGHAYVFVDQNLPTVKTLLEKAGHEIVLSAPIPTP